jgi:ribosomal protein S18 acetylase RimI-like enzyme
MDIREANLEDKQKLEEFLVFNNGEHNRKLAQEYIRCMFSNDYRKPTFMIATVGENIIGASAYSEEFFTVNTYGISWVSVHEEFRNHGIGKKLVEACLKRITEKANKDVSVILCTYPDKTKLYENIGFTHAGYDYGGGSYMLKTIRVKHEKISNE